MTDACHSLPLGGYGKRRPMLTTTWTHTGGAHSRLLPTVLRTLRGYATYGYATRLNDTLKAFDPELYDIMEKERGRQWKGIELIPSENFTSRAVLECLGSCFTNKYSEGLPGARYYGGNEFIDQNENLCIKRALECFRLDPEKWGVNVQPYSGSPANFAAYTAVLAPHDRLMGLELASGGHLTHGHMLASGKRISATSVYFESMAYRSNPNTGCIDYDELEQLASNFRPKLLIAGASAYPRDYDYPRMRKIADKVGAYLLSDISHISGLIAAQVVADAFPYSDIVTTTTHKSLRGPRAGMIFFRKGVRSTKPDGSEVKYDLEPKVNFAVFPMLQGGPHNHQIAAISTALKDAMTPEFVEYQKQVKRNSSFLAEEMNKRGFTLVSGGTENHLILADLRPLGVDGARVERVLELAEIALNKNSVPGDTKPFVPAGIRLGTPAMTSRGCTEADFTHIADFLLRGVNIAKSIKQKTGTKLKEFMATLSGPEEHPDIHALRLDVEAFAKQFPMPGFDLATMKYKE